MDLPGEFLPFLSVALHARVTGYVERVRVDRGSPVKKGDLLVELSAPEMAAQSPKANLKRKRPRRRKRKREPNWGGPQHL